MVDNNIFSIENSKCDDDDESEQYSCEHTIGIILED